IFVLMAARITSRYASMRCERRSPPYGKTSTQPSVHQTRTQQTTLDIATPKRLAALLHDIPPSTTTITRSRRSCDKARVMHAGLHSSQHGESHHAAPMEDPSNRFGQIML